MTLLAVLRHGRTDWNDAGRLQGRADISLNEAGRREIAQWRLPEPFASAMHWVASPLRRAMETAELLRPERSTLTIDARLAEMSFGAWEGRTISELRHELGPAFRANEARGLDFQPPGGESPRALCTRIEPFLTEKGNSGIPTVAVAHKAVIRAMISIGTGWDMTDDPPFKIKPATLFVMRLTSSGGICDIETMSLIPPGMPA